MDEEYLLNIINNNLQIKLKEKKLNGEVFTDSNLINNILNELPKEVWHNPYLKWLEPCAGIGNFMMLVYIRLMKSLSEWESNKTILSNHILNNMLYMIEINNENCKICKYNFSSNIICKDFLKYDTNIKYDIIISNPPFQDKHNIGSRNKLYEKIFVKSCSILKENGYLSFIVPDNMFSKLNNYLTNNNIIYINFLGNYFKSIQCNVCYFILNNTTKKYKTIIEDINGNKSNILLDDRKINPIKEWNNYTDELVNKYISKTKNNSVYNRGKNISEYIGSKYDVIYLPNKILKTDDILLAKGFGINKIIIFMMHSELKYLIDYNGIYGSGPNTLYIPFTSIDECKYLDHILSSNEFKLLVNITRGIRKFMKLALFQYLKIS